MPIAVHCTGCGRTLLIKDQYAGKTGTCPHCRNPIEVPASAQLSVDDDDWLAGIDDEPTPPEIPTLTGKPSGVRSPSVGNAGTSAPGDVSRRGSASAPGGRPASPASRSNQQNLTAASAAPSARHGQPVEPDEIPVLSGPPPKPLAATPENAELLRELEKPFVVAATKGPVQFRKAVVEVKKKPTAPLIDSEKIAGKMRSVVFWLAYAIFVLIALGWAKGAIDGSFEQFKLVIGCMIILGIGTLVQMTITLIKMAEDGEWGQIFVCFFCGVSGLVLPYKAIKNADRWNAPWMRRLTICTYPLGWALGLVLIGGLDEMEKNTQRWNQEDIQRRALAQAEQIQNRAARGGGNAPPVDRAADNGVAARALHPDARRAMQEFYGDDPLPEGPEGIRMLFERIDSTNPSVRSFAIERLRAMLPKEALRAAVLAELEARLDLSESRFAFSSDRDTLLSVYCNWATPAQGAKLIAYLDRNQEGLPHEDLLSAVVRLKTPEAAEAIVRLLSPRGAPFHARDALIRMGVVAEPVVLRRLRDGDFILRHYACEILREIGTTASLKPLRALARELETRDVAEEAIRAIRQRAGIRGGSSRGGVPDDEALPNNEPPPDNDQVDPEVIDNLRSLFR